MNENDQVFAGESPILAVTALDLARRYIGLEEVGGKLHNPAILAMLQALEKWVSDDETPWCSAFADHVAWLLDLPRPSATDLPEGVSPLAARSWLLVGEEVAVDLAWPGFDVVVLSRGAGRQPGPGVIKAPGHVGFFNGWTGPSTVAIVGGNQGNRVSVAGFPADRILSVRRLFPLAGG